MRSAKCLDVLNRWKELAIVTKDSKEARTLSQNLPLARLAARRVGQYIVEFVEQILHLASSLSLRHFVADAQLGGATVVAAAGD